MNAPVSDKAQNVEAVYPLTPLQQGMIFHSLFAPGSGVYVERLNCRFQGQLDVVAFQRACQQIVDRHGVLRTAFVGESQGELKQMVLKRVKLPFITLDWRELSAAQQQSRLEELQETERTEGFKLARAPLMRIHLIRLEDEVYHFLWSHHHLLLDGWSVPLLMREVFSSYEAYRLGVSPAWPDVRPFRDYISWLQQQDMDTARAYWQELLKGVSGATRIRLSPARGNGRGPVGERRVRLTPEQSQHVRRAAQAEQLTVNTLVHGAWALLLARLSGERNVLYGMTVSGRPAELSGVNEMVGLFINSLPVRVEVEWECDAGTWLRRLQEQQVESRQFEFSPLQEVQKWAGISGGERLFESLVVFENYPMETLLEDQRGSLKIDNVQLTEQTNYPLTVVAELRDRLVIRLKYDAAQFTEETIDRMLDQMTRIIEQMAAQPDRKLSDITLLTDAEREQILVKWNETAVTYPQDLHIHELIAAQAARQPRDVAVVYDSQSLTYEDLNRRANQLANYLIGLGVGPEIRVGVLLERSFEMVVSLVAVLKAGGAYVPLDPGYPQERLRHMIEDAVVAVILTRAGIAEQAGVSGAQIVDLGSEWEVVARCKETAPEVKVSAEMLAYVIYTSGSTGLPKGAMNTHAGILNRLLWMQEVYGLTAADRVLQKTPFSFDVSVWEFFWPLLAGAQLVLAKPGGHQDSSYLTELIRESGITVLHFVPSMLRVFIEESGVEQCQSIRQIISSGEALDVSLQKRVQQLLPQAELDNLYGPTEAAVDVTRWRCVVGDERAVVPIGPPIANVQMYVLDHMEPVPAGMLGELYIGGVQVGRGYWGRPDLTAERYVPHPHSARAGERLYRTGDAGRYLSDGSIEYVGRVDHQVKVRGNRIELGEIEAVLATHPGIREAVVRVVERSGSDGDLVGYIVKQPSLSATVEELREHLRVTLPEYMIPALFVELDEIPLSPNGKVDRRRLPEPGTARPELAQAFVAPDTENEKLLAGIWSRILRLERVGVHDNFFALGGDSIRSIQVRSLAQKSGLSFTLPQLFQSPTIHALARVAASAGEPLHERVKPLAPFGLISESDRNLLPDMVEDAYPLAMLQSGMLFHSEFNKDSAAYHNVTSYHLQAPFDLTRLQAAIAQVVTRHPALRTCFELFAYSEPLQLVYREVAVPIQVEDLRHIPEPEQKKIIQEWKETEKATPFDRSQPPLIRFKIHRRSEQTFQFSFAEHHAIVDGWSVATMLTELFSLYLSSVGLQTASVAPPPQLAYRDFIALERSALASETTQQFWLDTLNESVATVIPRWSNRSKDQQQQGNSVKSVGLTTHTTEALKRLAQTTETPLKSVLLAAHLRVLSLLSGQADVLTGLVANGRLEEDDGERVLGLFLNTLPFRLRMRGGSWMELVAAAFAAEQELLPHRRYPMARLQKQLKQTQLFDTSFDFTHFHVYQSLSDMKGILLEYDGYEETNFTLTANFALSLEADQVWLSLYFLPRELTTEQIEAISGYYVKTLTEMAEHPLNRYDYFSPLSETEREQILFTWNDTAQTQPRNRPIHQWVTTHAAQQPEAVALVCGTRQLTYQQLNHQANQLAHYLIDLGVGPEVRVGVLLERSVEMLVSLLAVLKAGAAYVPLDEGYPQDRLRYMIEDAEVAVLVTQDALFANRVAPGARILDLATEWEQISNGPESEPPVTVSDDMLAYVIYTSGSTGQPKGVQVSHGALINFLHSMQRDLDFQPGDSLLAVTSLSFDIAGLELYLPLLAGGRIILVSRQTATDGMALHETLSTSQAAMMQATPTTWRMLVEAGWQGDPALTILCGGEALSLDLAQELLPRGASVWNMYGPTETTIWSTMHRLGQHDRAVAIGRPIANTQVHIVDEHMNPAPVGTAGELLIAGDGLARGYRNRPDLTAEKFIPNPFADTSGARLYRTGDLARYGPDGVIECLGRLDNQVKIRGFRIELGDIEAALLQHEGVREAVVTARTDERAGANHDEHKRLVAYVILSQQTPPDTSELYLYLKERLPDYMLPTAFVALDNFPLTPNGKVDRKALPAPEQQRPALAAPHVAPRSELEMQLARLWSQVLSVPEVGVFDNFFELGGDSILCLQLTARARHEGLQLRPEQVFANPTIAALSLIVAEAGQEETESVAQFSLAQLEPRQLDQLLERYQPVADIYPLSPMQEGMFFNHLYEPALGIGSEQVSCRLRGELDVAALRRVWQEVTARHAVLRTAIAWEGLQSPVQVVVEDVALPWNEIDWSHLSAEEQESRLDQFLVEDRLRGLDVRNAPLMRFHLIKLGERLYHFIWDHHHLLLDGWSIPLIMREVFSGYEAFQRGLAPQWSQPRPFRDYISWLQQQDLPAAQAYWQSVLSGVSGPTRLGLNRGPNGDRGAEQSLRLSATESEQVRRAAQLMKVAVNTLVQGAWTVLLGRFSGEREVVYGVTVSGRPAELAGVDEMVGLFINSLPVRVRVEQEQEVGDWLRRIQEQQVESRKYEYTPLAQLQQWSGLESGQKLFESLIVFENYPMEESLRDGSGSLEITNFKYVDPPQAELMLMVVPGEQVLIRMMYQPGLFAEGLGEQVLAHFKLLLLSISRQHSGTVRELEFPPDTQPRRPAAVVNESFASDQFSFEVG